MYCLFFLMLTYNFIFHNSRASYTVGASQFNLLATETSGGSLPLLNPPRRWLSMQVTAFTIVEQSRPGDGFLGAVQR